MTRFSRAAMSRRRERKTHPNNLTRLQLALILQLAVLGGGLWWAVRWALSRDSDVVLSPGFPTSVHREPFETIVHPVYEYMPKDTESLTLEVPKFYDPPEFATYGGIRAFLGQHGDRRMTRDEARRIQTSVPSRDGSVPRLDTVLVALSSFRDWMCPHTVENIFSRAAYPERIRVAIVDQRLLTDGGVNDVSCSEPLQPCELQPEQALCKYRDHIDVLTVDASLATGPVFARHLGYRMFRGETFVLQCDAHVQFSRGWDSDIIEQWESTKNEMAVLTAYVNAVQDNIDEETGEVLSQLRPIMCDSIFEGEGRDRHLRHDEEPDYAPDVVGSPQLEPHWAAGFSFSRAHFIINVPYDQHLPQVFQGEEVSIGIRGFTYGYDYYAPERNVMFHYYQRPPNPNADRIASKEQNSNGHQEKEKSAETIPLYSDQENYDEEMEIKAMMRLTGIIHMSPPGVTPDQWRHDEERKYGIGKVRTPELFFETFGIHVDTQTLEENLCMFVASPEMHEMFVPHLRPDGMGIDYSKLGGFRFKDRWPKREYWWEHPPQAKHKKYENAGNGEGDEEGAGASNEGDNPAPLKDGNADKGQTSTH